MAMETQIAVRVAVAALSCVCGAALAQSTVTYGRITAVKNTTVTNKNAQVGGALVGGTIGLISGSGRSSSNQALRGIGGAVAGQQIGKAATKKQAFEYTILLDGKSTTTIVTDEAGMRVGDCVAVERGAYNNLRLVDDARCERGSTATPVAVKEADACIAAKQQLLEAKTDEAFNLSRAPMRVLCAD